MLQWEWPKTWPTESKEVIRISIERAIRKAMSGGKNAQIRGVVSVDELNLGCIPPEISLNGIRELSVEHTAIMVKVHYHGDFSMRLRGLEINLDTVGASAEEADANFALPFFCPFEMTLRDIQIDGMVSIEIFHELEENPQWEQNSSLIFHTEVKPRVVKNNVRRPSRSVRSSGTNTCLGYGALLAGGGRRGMRPPGALETTEASLPLLDADGATDGVLKSSSPARNSVPSFADILEKKVIVKRRMMKLQLFGDPLKKFRVVSNFGTVPGANSKVEGTVRMLIKPAIEALMEEGIIFTL
ncbi:hypothetical protein C3747_6g303 [Trypanosoma cruzi]|uniref:SMP-LTD domain-containing protein n=2 Tax=Trypanosoma cruzi TaxID=5693 RepID=Q4DUF3_TRYCC|nr:hypothetical protein, conserved [Trypanosoma cruzi]EAN96164.1 hypothetical protein, conserved [Trypanosoma cruzi]PWV20584.1 hypothetical protein C3747_6g303 [Trypanosoma cruzi]RNC61908.1 hypothetical protein TcCL_ESM00296 [Trypanosoma cruzi]|eukprot:XP_818015.1 hypothetical protein [Trypanosoma cruzi strain CL Brener]